MLKRTEFVDGKPTLCRSKVPYKPGMPVEMSPFKAKYHLVATIHYLGEHYIMRTYVPKEGSYQTVQWNGPLKSLPQSTPGDATTVVGAFLIREDRYVDAAAEGLGLVNEENHCFVNALFQSVAMTLRCVSPEVNESLGRIERVREVTDIS